MIRLAADAAFRGDPAAVAAPGPAAQAILDWLSEQVLRPLSPTSSSRP